MEPEFVCISNLFWLVTPLKAIIVKLWLSTKEWLLFETFLDAWNGKNKEKCEDDWEKCSISIVLQPLRFILWALRLGTTALITLPLPDDIISGKKKKII